MESTSSFSDLYTCYGGTLFDLGASLWLSAPYSSYHLPMLAQVVEELEPAPQVPEQQPETEPSQAREIECEEEIDGPPEIIWEGNQITVRKRKVKKSEIEPATKVSKDTSNWYIRNTMKTFRGDLSSFCIDEALYVCGTLSTAGNCWQAQGNSTCSAFFLFSDKVAYSFSWARPHTQCPAGRRSNTQSTVHTHPVARNSCALGSGRIRCGKSPSMGRFSSLATPEFLHPDSKTANLCCQSYVDPSNPSDARSSSDE